MDMEPNRIFRMGCKGDKNIFTPNIVGYYWSASKDFVYEISSGSGIGSGKMFGCTVVSKAGVHRRDLSKVFGTENEARFYGNQL